jgi:nucleoside-diphosphate-sugar epimerase
METGRGTQGIAQVDEANPLDMTSDRVQGEEYLRSIGATVLRASGIYGPALGPHPARNPLSWLRRGMIASADSWVNLVHVSDLASAILEALNRDLGGDQLIVSDGTPRRWGDIADWAVGKGLVEEVRYAGAGGRPSKRLSNARLISRAGHVIAHPDLFAELQAIEGRGGSEGASRGR